MKDPLKYCALSLATIVATLELAAGHIIANSSISKSNNSLNKQKQNSISLESTEATIMDLDGFSPEIHRVVSLSSGEGREILLSDMPHIYETIGESAKTKLYLADENGQRLSNNYDDLSLLKDYTYLKGGLAYTSHRQEIGTDKQYDLFVGTTLRKNSSGESLTPRISLLDHNGLELYSFNGELKKAIENTVVIRDCSDDLKLGDPDTYAHNYVVDEETERHDAIDIFEYECGKDETTSYLIGLDHYRSNDGHVKWQYSFYDENLKVTAIVLEDEIEDWYTNNYFDYVDYNDYDEYFKSIYQRINGEKNKQKTLKK